MVTAIRKTTPRSYARITGLLYLLIAIFGGFSMGYLPTVIIEQGDAIITAQNIAENQELFKLGILAEVTVCMLEIIITVMLYRLLKPVNKTLSMTAAFSRLVMIMVIGIGIVNYLIPIHLLSDPGYLRVFKPDQLQSLALFSLNVHQYTVYIWQFFFGLHLLLLGYLVFKSGYFPKALGVLMMIGSLGYTVESLGVIISPDNTVLAIIVAILLGVVILGELSFAFWLLIKGLNVEKWNKSIASE